MEKTEYDRSFYNDGPLRWTEYPELRLRHLTDDDTVVQFNYSVDPAREAWRNLGGYHDHE